MTNYDQRKVQIQEDSDGPLFKIEKCSKWVYFIYIEVFQASLL